MNEIEIETKAGPMFYGKGESRVTAARKRRRR
jgi:hypothetical protein